MIRNVNIIERSINLPLLWGKNPLIRTFNATMYCYFISYSSGECCLAFMRACRNLRCFRCSVSVLLCSVKLCSRVERAIASRTYGYTVYIAYMYIQMYVYTYIFFRGLTAGNTSKPTGYPLVNISTEKL